MSNLVIGTISGIVFGALSAAALVPMSFPGKPSSMLASFINRLGIGIVIGAAALPWPGWWVGLGFGLLLSLPGAINTRNYLPMMAMGGAGGTIIGWIVQRFGQ